MMNLEALQEKWAEQDRKLDVSIRLNLQVLSAMRMNRVRPALQRLALFLAVESAITLAVVIGLGSFIGDHIATLRFAAPAAALDLFEIASLIVLIRQIALALHIDYSQPIAVIQKQIESLRVLRIRFIQWTFLSAPLLWTPLLIVALKGLWDVDAYKILGVAFLLANLAAGLAAVLLAIWLSKKFAGRMGHSPTMQRLMGTLAGYNLNAATSFLATLSEFTDEQRVG